MKTIFLRLLAIMAITLVSIACGPPSPFSIDTPEAWEAYLTPPDLVISYEAALDPFGVALNGIDILSDLAIGETSATADGNDIAYALLDGENLLVINGEKRYFYYDITGPDIHILSVTEGNPLTVTGFLSDPSGPASLEIAGNAISLDTDFAFTASIANTDYIDMTTADEAGQITDITYVRPDVTLEGSAFARLPPAGIEDFETVIETYFGDIDIKSLLIEVNPVRICLIICVNLTITDATLGTPNAEFTITGPGTFHVVADLPNLWAAGSVIGVPGVVNATNAHLEISGSLSLVNGVVVTSTTTEVTDLYFYPGDSVVADFAGIPSWIEGLLVPVLVPIVQDQLGDVIDDHVKDLLTVLLDEFPAHVTLDFNDAAIRLDAGFDDLAIEDGGLTLLLDSTLTPESGLIHDVLGSVYDSAPMPFLPDVSPTGANYHFGAMLSKNLVNQALAVGHQAGLTDLQIELQSAEVIAALGVNLGIFKEGDTARLTLLPVSPAHLDLTNQEGGIGRVSLADGFLTIEIKPAGGEYTHVGSAVANLNAGIDLAVDANNALAPSLVGQPRIVIKSVTILNINWSNQFIENLALYALPALTPSILEGIGVVQVPSIASFTIIVDEMWTVDDNFIGLTGNLVPE